MSSKREVPGKKGRKWREGGGRSRPFRARWRRTSPSGHASRRRRSASARPGCWLRSAATSAPRCRNRSGRAGARAGAAGRRGGRLRHRARAAGRGEKAGRRSPECELRRGRHLRAAVRDGSFDIVGTIRTLHHLERPEKAMPELVRVAQAERPPARGRSARSARSAPGSGDRPLRAGARSVARANSLRSGHARSLRHERARRSCARRSSGSCGTSRTSSTEPDARARSASGCGASRRRPRPSRSRSAGMCSSAASNES